MRGQRSLEGLGILLTLSPLLLAATPPKPAPPPEVGVKTVAAGGARRIDAVLPGKVLATAFPRGADGKRRVLVLVAPGPDSPRESISWTPPAQEVKNACSGICPPRRRS